MRRAKALARGGSAMPGAHARSRGAGYSRWTDRSVHLCFRTPRARFPRTRLLSHVLVVLSPLPVTHTTGWAGALWFDAFPVGFLPSSRHRAGLALMPRSSLRSLAPDRPHGSLSEAFPSACASGAIPSPTRPTVGTSSVPALSGRGRFRRSPVPWLASVGRGSPPGLRWRCTPVRIAGCRRRIRCPLGSSASASGAGCDHGFPPLCLRCPSMPARRDTQREAARLRRFAPLHAVENQSRAWGEAVTPAPGGRDLHPHGELRYKALGFATYPRTESPINGSHLDVGGVDHPIPV